MAIRVTVYLSASSWRGYDRAVYHRGLSKAKEIEDSRVRTENEAKSIISEVRKGENRRELLLYEGRIQTRAIRWSDVRDKRQN